MATNQKAAAASAPTNADAEKGKVKPSYALGKNKAVDQEEEELEEFMESKMFRLITLFLYISGVGGLGFCLTLYYLFFFDTRMPEVHNKFPMSVQPSTY